MENVLGDLSDMMTSLSFPYAYSTIYSEIGRIGPENVVLMARDSVKLHFDRSVSGNNGTLREFATAYDSYVCYSDSWCCLFAVVERFVDFACRPVVVEQFIETWRATVSCDDVICVFMEEFEKVKVVEGDGGVFETLSSAAKFILTVFEERVDEFVSFICASISEYGNMFRENANGYSTDEFVTEALNVLNYERNLAERLFGACRISDRICEAVYSVVVRDERSPFIQCVYEISDRCRRRDVVYLAGVHDVAFFCEAPPAMAQAISDAIRKQLDEEEFGVPDVALTMTWYADMIKDAFRGNRAVYARFCVDIARFVNHDKRLLFNGVMKYINGRASSDGDLSAIELLLQSVSSKTELEILYTQAAARRIVSASEARIKKEQCMLEQVLKTSANYELHKLKDLLRDARASMDLHIGPVVVVPAGLWPFRPPFPAPVSLVQIADGITSKYQRMFRNRVVRYPVDVWEVNIRYTPTNTVIAGNGIQAEILLYMNDHIQISSDSLEPQISRSLVAASLQTLLTPRFPVLSTVCTDCYTVNRKLERTLPVIRLARPRPVSEHTAVSAQLSQLRDDCLDSAIVRLLKAKRSLSSYELELLVTSSVSNHFAVDVPDIRHRISSLEAKGYLRRLPDSFILYTP